MMRTVAIIVLLACHVEAVKLTTGNALEGLVKMMKGLIQASVEDTLMLEKACAEEITALEQTRVSLRSDLNRHIAADKVPSKNGGVRECANCGGEWLAFEEARTICSNNFGTQQSKALAARQAMNVHLYNSANPSPIKCQDYATAPISSDESACATEWRIDFKEDQEASVAKQCKKTNEIMEIAMNIYKSKGMGASFIQLAEEENLRADAKEFLESHSETERNAELLKLLHDFHQQVKRDCHQDLSDLKADINALNLHLMSKRNSAASENKAYDTATKRQHEADMCQTAEAASRDRVHEEAYQTYVAFAVICPPTDVAESATYNCDGGGNADFVCGWRSTTDRIGAGCQGSLMHKEGYCAQMKKEAEDYRIQLSAGVDTLNLVINGAPNAFFLQVDSEQNAEGAPAETAMVQTEAVDFGNLVDAISLAMKNEISKLNTDSSDVNQFAAACEASLTVLDLPAQQEVGGCTYNAGNLCSEQSPTSETCGVCMQEDQCYELKDLAIVHANNEATKQNEQDEAKALFEEAQAAYAQAATIRSNNRQVWQRKKNAHDENYAALTQAQSDLQTFADANQDNANAEQINNLMTTIDASVADMLSQWNAIDLEETNEKEAWDNGASSNPNAQAYHIAKTSMECSSDNNAEVSLSHYCDAEAAKTEKIAFASQKSQTENQVFNECTRTESTLNLMKKNLEAKKQQCKVGVTKDLKEELHKMTEALQILQQAKSKIAGTA